MYSTCVSEWRVPLMNVTPETIGQSPWERTTFSAPMPFNTVNDGRVGEAPLERAGRRFEPHALVATIANVERLQLVRIVGRRHPRRGTPSSR